MHRAASVKSSPLRSFRVEHEDEDELSVSSASSQSETTSAGVDISLGGLFKIKPSPVKPASRRTPPPQPHSLELLRKELDTRHPGVLRRIAATGERVDEAFLERWLTARGDSTVDALAAHAAWRESFVGPGNDRISEDSIMHELAAEKVFLQGPDLDGFPTLLFGASHHRAGVHAAEDTTRLMAYAIDNALASTLASKSKVVCIFDMAGVGAWNIDVAFLKSIFELLQTHYPNCLRSLYFINSPFVFWGVWRCVTPFVSPHTRSKIAFLSGATGMDELLQIVGPACLPPDLGGTAEKVPVQAAVAIARGDACVWHHAPAEQRPGRASAALDRLKSGVASARLAVGRGGRAAERAARMVTPRMVLNRAVLKVFLTLGILAKIFQIALRHFEVLDALQQAMPSLKASIFKY